MFRTKEECLKIMNEALNTYSYSDLVKKVEEAMQNSDKIVKSYNSKPSLYGMYYPDPVFYKYFKYRGRVTKSDKKFTYKYYYQGDKVLFTEQYSEDYDVYTGKGNGVFNLIQGIFYFYYEDHVDILICNARDNKVSCVARVIYVDGKVQSFIEANVSKNSIYLYHEWVFVENSEFLYEKFYGSFFIGDKLYENEHEGCTKTIYA